MQNYGNCTMKRKSSLLDSAAEHLHNIMANVPATAIKEDIRQNIHSTLSGLLYRMELVTREDFDVQQAVLQHTRQKLEELEKKVKWLEEQLNSQP